MSSIQRAGNDENNRRLSFWDIKVWDEAVKFANAHEKNFIFGEGRIGKALAFYFREAEIPFEGHITSNTLNDLKEVYEKEKNGVFLGLTDWYYQEIMPELMSFMDISDIFFIPETEKKYLENQFTLSNIKNNFWLTVYAAYNCNINCKSCLVHSPLCKSAYYDYSQLVKDISKLKELDISVHRMNFSGGEPMLNPRILDMFRFVRREFPDIPTTCFTNGSLLSKLNEEELIEMRDIGVEFAVTEYPLSNDKYHSDLARFYEKAIRLNLTFQKIDDEDDKEFYKHPYDLDGNRPKHEFINCHRFRNCYMLCIHNGILDKCYNCRGAEKFNEYFGTEMKLTKQDYICLENIKNADEIYEYCMKRLPFCSFCKPIGDSFSWGVSERKIEEWT